MPKISIIVPVYKVEKYLHKCVDSILKQTFKDFELILVDDGSPDKSGDICDEYARKDNRVRVIHKENGGVSDARNVGIDIAEGEYIGFVDGDDYIASDMYEVLYNSLIDNSADISGCGMYECIGDRIKENNIDGNLHVFTNEDATKEVLYGKILPAFVFLMLYKKSLFEGKRFPLGKIYEDSFLLPRLFLESKKIILISQPKYYYVRREDSFTMRRFCVRFFDAIEVAKCNLSLVQKYFPAIEEQAKFRYLWAHFFVLDKMLLEDNYKEIDRYKDIVYVLKKNTKEILKNDCFERSRKISILLINLSVGLYRILVLKKYKKKFG